MTTQLPTERLKVAQNPNANAGTVLCARCRKRWTGLKTAHCTACHQTFTAPTAADKHRTGSHHHGTRHCLDPATVGLTDAGRNYPCWGQPKTDNRWNTH